MKPMFIINVNFTQRIIQNWRFWPKNNRIMLPTKLDTESAKFVSSPIPYDVILILASSKSSDWWIAPTHKSFSTFEVTKYQIKRYF